MLNVTESLKHTLVSVVTTVQRLYTRHLSSAHPWGTLIHFWGHDI